MNLLRTTTSFFALISWTFASRATEEDTMAEVWVVSGGRVSLPCVPRPKVPGDQPVLVLWYRRFSSSLPIYSYDARVGDFSSGVRWWDEVVLGRRGYFVPSSTPSLVLEPAHAHDQDVYTCRIDYRVSTSTTTRVNLTVVVPPGPPVVMWEGREMVGTVGPLQENQLTELTCRSVGGSPAPSLSWWNEGRELPLLLSHSSWDPVTGTSTTEATVSVTAKRELQGASLTCYTRMPSQPSASGDARILPRSVSVSLSITLSPVEVRILEQQDALVATSGSTVSVVCRALGSHPPAELSWWRGIRSLEPHVTHAIRDGGNITTATLTIAVTGEDDGATITCTGANPALPHEPLSDRRKLIVYYEPIVDLSLGKQLEAENIKEEDEVSFECHIKSNPKFHRIEWHHNGQDIPQNVSAGVVVSGQSLVLRSVARSHSGSYACAATNAQGRTVSNTLFLTVKHAPTCAGSAGQARTQGAARGAAVKARCRVEAEPPSDLTWSWVRQKTDGSEEILSPDKYVVEGLTSTLTVVPGRREDYGRLLCRATNNVGRQKEACVVNLVPAGPPDTPTNCSATTVNPDGMKPALVVSCLEGFDGGLPQNFLLEAWQDGLVIANISSEYPEWVVSTVEAGKRVILNIVGHNIRGRSDPVTMKIQTSSAQHRAAPVQESAGEVPPIVGAALGGMGVILVLLLVGVAIVRGSYRCPRKPVAEKTLASSSTEALDPDVVQSIKHLDIVPCVREEHSNEE
ncbi:nephrin-like, partial [Macrobrachium nipponense]|uniref:nephrin-like n=1 Tax=Macrobrachium nipponense TaxID=159736 RepID=UPI0030C7EA68